MADPQTIDQELVKLTPDNILFKVDSNSQSAETLSSSFQITNINKEGKIAIKLNTQSGLYQLKPAVGVINQGETLTVKVMYLISKAKEEELFKANSIRVDSFKVTKDMEPIADIKNLIKDIKDKASKRMNKIKIAFEKEKGKKAEVEQAEAYGSEPKEPKLKVDKSVEELKKENDKQTAQLNLLKTQLSDKELMQEQLKKEIQKSEADKQSTSKSSTVKENKSNIGLPIAVIVCLLALVIGYVLTK